MRVAVDTNVLAYAEGVNDAARQAEALALLDRLPRQAIFLPVQVLGELFNVLTRMGHASAADSRIVVSAWAESASLIPTTQEVMGDAMRLALDHHLRIWDAVILAAAAEGGCSLLLSEDMQDGFAWGGVTVANPFAAEPHALIGRSLRDST